ncbi:MAG: hypothetical protein CMJ90_15160 [Planctomycetes bacterium]|nr:hypothetical protein [Planctomycetota bacterium]
MALIMVLAVLMALMVLAVPFLSISTNENKASVAPYARAQARDRAAAIQSYARYMLTLGHREEEALRAEVGVTSGEGAVRSSPDWDVAEEARVAIDLLNSKGEPMTGEGNLPLMHPLDPRGVTGDVKVRDEQAFPNILSSPPFLIAATLGRTTLAQDITDTDTEISVNNAENFPTANGKILMDGEVISYSSKDGSTFMGCQRGLEGGLKAARHRADAWVIDDRAREIAMLPYKSPRASGRWREPHHPTFVKEIALLGESALTSNEVDRLIRDFAILGQRFASGHFGRKVPLLADINPASYDGNGFAVTVRSVSGFPPGTVVRITDGQQTEYGMVCSVRGRDFGRIVLHDPPRGHFVKDRSSVAPLLRHPVNINSAPRAVLYRLIEGLQMGQGGAARGTNGRVDEDAAALVVEGIISNRPIQGLKRFRELLAELADGAEFIFDEFQSAAVFRNAVDSTDSSVATGTVPFCFRSFDYYTIDSVAVVNDRSGRELARHGVRERVHVAPLGVITRTLQSQRDFEGPFFRVRYGPWTATHPYPTARWETATSQPHGRLPMMMYRFGTLGQMSVNSQNEEEDDQDLTFEGGVFPHQEEGDVRLLPARMEGRGYSHHFDPPGYLLADKTVKIKDLDAEGMRLASGPFEMNPRDSRGPGVGGQSMLIGGGNRSGRGRGGRGGGGRSSGGRGQASGSLQGRSTVNPIRFDVWYRTGAGSGGGRQVVFHYGTESSEEDEISLAIESDGSLVGRVAGRTFDDELDAMEEVAQTRWMPEDGAGFWKARTWYHLGFAYRGTKPDDLMLFVDGFKRGSPRYQTQLSSSLSVDDNSFDVEDAEGWPLRGVALVGSEVIAFERSGESFEVVQHQGLPWGRGRRGTKALGHESGTTVTLFGYSTAPRGASTRSSVVIPRGGATLADALGPPVVATFAHNATMTLQVPAGGGLTIPIQLRVHDPAAPSGNELELIGDSEGTLDFDCFPASGGYVVICSVGSGLPNAPVGGVEFARYTSRSGSTLVGLQGVLNPPNETLGQGAATGQFAISLNRLIHPIQLVGTGPVAAIQQMAAVFPVSINVGDTSGLMEPQSPRGGSGDDGNGNTFLNAQLPNWDTDPEFVQIGNPNTDSLDANDIEWIRYHHIDGEGNILCDEARFIQAAAQWIRSRHLGPGQNITDAHLGTNLFLPFRMQCGTEMFTDGRASSGGEVVPCIRTVSHSRREAINVESWGTMPAAPVTGGRWSAAGWGDNVTIEGPRGDNRKQATVAWAGVDEPEVVTFGIGENAVSVRIRRNYEGHGWLAFTTSPGTEYRQRSLPGNGQTEQRNRYVRLLKFPSGEMPDIAQGGRAFVGGSADKEVADSDGYIDEIRVASFEPERFVLWNHTEMDLVGPLPADPNNPTAPPPSGTISGGASAGGIDETTDEIPIAAVEWLISNPRSFGPNPRFYILPDGRQILFEEELQSRGLSNNDAGLVMIDDEVIAFRSIGTSSGGGPALLDCERGYMNTIASAHGFGANVVILDFVNVTMLQNGLEASSNRLEVADASGFLRNGGTVLVNDELLHYTTGERTALVMPWLMDEDGDTEGGLFRGRFGTQVSSHDSQAIVLDMPFRYWDRYVPKQDAADQSWYGFGLDLPGAFFHELVFEKYRRDEYTDIEVLVRTDADVSWGADPQKTTGLYLFTDSEEGEPNLIDTAGDGLGVRVMFKYMSGAFDPINMRAHGWKSTPELRSMQLTYLDQTRVLTREEKR